MPKLDILPGENPEMRKALRQAATAQRELRRAEGRLAIRKLAYRKAVADAHDTGASFGQLAAVLGVTRSAVFETVNAPREPGWKRGAGSGKTGTG